MLKPIVSKTVWSRLVCAGVLVRCSLLPLGAEAAHRFLVLQASVDPASPYVFVPENLGPLVAGQGAAARAMRGFAQKALDRFRERFGHAPANDLQQAVAVADWVATVMKHPAYWPKDPVAPRYNPLHDGVYNDLQPDPWKMLDYTLRFDPADAESWPSPQCGHQNRVVIGLLNALGLYGRVVVLQLHTGLEFFSFRLHKWVYLDATHNEHYVLRAAAGAGPVPLNAAELHGLTLAHRLGEVAVVKHGYPGADVVYLALNPQGFLRYAVPMDMKQYGAEGKAKGGPENFLMVAEDLPRPATHALWSAQDPNHAATEPTWFQFSGVRDPALASPVLDALGLEGGVAVDGAGVHFTLRSALPYTVAFQRFLPAGRAWSPLGTVAAPGALPAQSAVLNLSPGAGTVRLRAVDTAGNASQEFVIHVE